MGNSPRSPSHALHLRKGFPAAVSAILDTSHLPLTWQPFSASTLPPPPSLDNSVCLQPPPAGVLRYSHSHCPRGEWSGSSPLLLPTSQLSPVHPTQPPMMACVRTLTFSFAVPGPLRAHDASQARTESWPCQPHRVLWVTYSLLGASPTVWTPAHQGRLKPLRSGVQPELARSLCLFGGWNAGPQFHPQVPGRGLSIVSSLVPAFSPSLTHCPDLCMVPGYRDRFTATKEYLSLEEPKESPGLEEML